MISDNVIKKYDNISSPKTLTTHTYKHISLCVHLHTYI